MVVKLRHLLIPDCPVAFSSKLNSVVYACPVSSAHSPHACPCSAHTGLSGPTATRHPPPCLLPLPHLPTLAHSCRPWFAPNVVAEAWRRGIPPLPSAFPFTSCIILINVSSLLPTSSGSLSSLLLRASQPLSFPSVSPLDLTAHPPHHLLCPSLAPSMAPVYSDSTHRGGMSVVTWTLA